MSYLLDTATQVIEFLAATAAGGIIGNRADSWTMELANACERALGGDPDTNPNLPELHTASPEQLAQHLSTETATELLRLLKTAQDNNGIQQHIDNRGATIGKQYNAGRDIRFGNDD